jgi:hypothetical protein
MKCSVAHPRNSLPLGNHIFLYYRLKQETSANGVLRFIYSLFDYGVINSDYMRGLIALQLIINWKADHGGCAV